MGQIMTNVRAEILPAESEHIGRRQRPRTRAPKSSKKSKKSQEPDMGPKACPKGKNKANAKSNGRKGGQPVLKKPSAAKPGKKK